MKRSLLANVMFRLEASHNLPANDVRYLICLLILACTEQGRGGEDDKGSSGRVGGGELWLISWCEAFLSEVLQSIPIHPVSYACISPAGEAEDAPCTAIPHTPFLGDLFLFPFTPFRPLLRPFSGGLGLCECMWPECIMNNAEWIDIHLIQKTLSQQLHSVHSKTVKDFGSFSVN